MTYIKACGLSRLKDIEYANILKPDYVGFIFANSSRRVSVDEALILKKHLNKEIKAVGVFVDSDVKDILDIVNKGIIDVIQLHGKQGEEIITRLKSNTLAPIIKAFSVTSLESILEASVSSADMILLDSIRAGSGRVFDWEIIQEAYRFGFRREFFLAGGLNIKNIDYALKLHPYGVDMSSGLERNNHKDFERMKEIIVHIRSYDANT